LAEGHREGADMPYKGLVSFGRDIGPPFSVAAADFLRGRFEYQKYTLHVLWFAFR